jgi:hypothetical protein
MHTVLMGIGGLLGLIVWIWTIVLGFKKSVAWGLLCLFIAFPCVIIFLLMNVKKGGGLPLILLIVSIILNSIGYALAPKEPLDADGNPIVPEPSPVEFPVPPVE